MAAAGRHGRRRREHRPGDSGSTRNDANRHVQSTTGVSHHDRTLSGAVHQRRRPASSCTHTTGARADAPRLVNRGAPPRFVGTRFGNRAWRISIAGASARGEDDTLDPTPLDLHFRQHALEGASEYSRVGPAASRHGGALGRALWRDAAHGQSIRLRPRRFSRVRSLCGAATRHPDGQEPGIRTACSGTGSLPALDPAGGLPHAAGPRPGHAPRICVDVSAVLHLDELAVDLRTRLRRPGLAEALEPEADRGTLPTGYDYVFLSADPGTGARPVGRGGGTQTLRLDLGYPCIPAL